MTLAIFRAMLLSLLRDPGALVMSFAMPVAFFVIFAEIFANAAGGEFELRVAVLDEVKSPESGRLLTAVRRDPAVHRWLPAASRADVVRAVRRGDADAGLVVRADGEPLGSTGGFGPAPLLVYSDPSSAVAGSVLTGRLQQAYATALPELLVGGVVDLVENQFTELDERQRDDIRAGLDDIRASAMKGQAPAWSLADLIEEQSVAGRPAASNHVAYYAGAIAFMFLLLSAAQGALVLFDERDNGVLDRIVAGPGGVGVSVNGKFLYLTAQGLAQTVVIFAVAWARYGVDVAAAPGSWLATAVLSSAAAAGIGLVLVTACRSRAQAQTLSTAAILVMSAVGGSMVPRFFMPGWLQNVGWLTPNTWVLEVYSGILWRNESLGQLAFPCVMLALVSAATFLATHILARRMVRG
jgi:ABC-2 type transport system permease protein